jgi:hypothetical protein
MLLDAARQAEAAGDYGIAAALVIRDPNTELIGLGRPAVLSTRDPLGHRISTPFGASSPCSGISTLISRSILGRGRAI